MLEVDKAAVTRGTIIAAAVFVSSCAFLDPRSSGGSPSSSNSTLNVLMRDGLPKLTEWLPSLPSEFSNAQGMTGLGDGLPNLVSSQLASDLDATASSSDLGKLLGEAQGIAAWGFSETRRLEALFHAAGAPLFDALSQQSLFSKLSSEGTTVVNLSSSGNGSIWESLIGNLKFSVQLPKILGLPAYLVLAATPDGRGVSAAGVWADAAALTTGFVAEIFMGNKDNQKISLAVAPSRMGTVVPAWSGQTCADDVYGMEISRNTLSGAKQFALKSWECPNGRNTTAHVAVRFDGTTTVVESALAQSFAAASLVGPRRLLGARQGFVLQAASRASGAGNAVAAALAVVGESDFAKPLSKLFSDFSISSLVTRYVQHYYLKPLIDSEASLNLAACNIVTTSTSENMSKLCNDEDIDPTMAASAVSQLSSFASTAGLSSIAANLNTIDTVLGVKNSIFLSQAQTQYGTPPSPAETFTSLDATRSSLDSPTPQSLTTLPESIKSRFVSYASAAKLPATEFSVSGALGGFLGDECKAIVGDALSKSGGNSAGASSFCSSSR